MNDNAVIEIARKEQSVLKELLKALQRERDAIISFSVESIVLENNRKEEILGRLEFLRDQQEKLLSTLADRERLLGSSIWKSIMDDMERTVLEVKTAIQKNTRLLSFSVEHVKSSIEHIMTFINNSNYGKKPELTQLLLSKVV